MTAKFLVVDADDHGFTFVLAAQGETLLRGLAHATREAARREAERVRSALTSVQVYSEEHEHRVVLRGEEGGLLAISHRIVHYQLVLGLRDRIAGTGGGVPIEDLHPRLPSVLPPREVADVVRARMAAGGAGDVVVWVSDGDEVAVHLDSVEVAVRRGLIAVSLDLESDQTGRGPVMVAFAVGTDGHPAATSSAPGGHPALAARWGEAVRAAAWAAVQDLALEHGAERGAQPSGIAAVDGAVRLLVRAPPRDRK